MIGRTDGPSEPTAGDLPSLGAFEVRVRPSPVAENVAQPTAAAARQSVDDRLSWSLGGPFEEEKMLV